MLIAKTLAAAAMLAMTSSFAIAHDYKVGDLTIDHPWTRATPPKAKAGGGFATITNLGSEDDRLVSASSSAANRVEIHEMAVKDGIMTMREKEDGIALPAGETIALEPGGLHIMFMQLNGPFEEGSLVPVTLTFEKSGTIEVDMTVEKMGAKGKSHDGHHGDHHSSKHTHN